jgi:pimeloyl-ACP methyl ester carboxylesterase
MEAIFVATFVLVPGGWSGAWWYREAAGELRRRGHQAHPVPLTGVGERAAQLTASVNLDTHIQDVVAHIEAEQIADAVLVGHSYGGMVITGVAEALPGRIRRLIYSDAYVRLPPPGGDPPLGLDPRGQPRRHHHRVEQGQDQSAPQPRTTRPSRVRFRPARRPVKSDNFGPG